MSTPFDFTTGPAKVYIDRFDFKVINGHMHLHVKSADVSHVFVMDLSLAKKLSKGLAQQVDQIEKANNVTFDDRLDNEPMKSPLQIKHVDEGGSSEKK